ncbi:hypothetical protein B0T17DRAFT_545657 [Bombardia bombarda]|uniref:2EXR domain-containing protein n=1 Tax=Bombardia bombarda TaxID=252184 RepID=A0AA39W9Q3_9PEZI|nr:hypothetical protein B0T17DRAFT_545657 [Bombardia bombarda]
MAQENPTQRAGPAFNDLPVEIRLMIYAATWETRRMALHFEVTEFDVQDPNGNHVFYQDDLCSLIHLSRSFHAPDIYKANIRDIIIDVHYSHAPVTLHLNRESRHETLRHYCPVFPTADHVTYFNPALDTMEVRWRYDTKNPDNALESMLKALKIVKHLVIDREFPLNFFVWGPAATPGLLTRMERLVPCVQTIDLFYHSFSDDYDEHEPPVRVCRTKNLPITRVAKDKYGLVDGKWQPCGVQYTSVVEDSGTHQRPIDVLQRDGVLLFEEDGREGDLTSYNDWSVLILLDRNWSVKPEHIRLLAAFRRLTMQDNTRLDNPTSEMIEERLRIMGRTMGYTTFLGCNVDGVCFDWFLDTRTPLSWQSNWISREGFDDSCARSSETRHLDSWTFEWLRTLGVETRKKVDDLVGLEWVKGEPGVYEWLIGIYPMLYLYEGYYD